MREIKFRAWDKTSDVMRNDISSIDFMSDGTIAQINVVSGVDILFPDKEAVLMQYTGLKDKNGTEIYEGDIVKYHNRKDSYELHQIIYEEKAAAFLLFGANAASRHPVYVKYLGDIAKSNKSYDTRTYELCEVIGNIYENPELLNPKEKTI